jgi:hypothetical protein
LEFSSNDTPSNKDDSYLLLEEGFFNALEWDPKEWHQDETPSKSNYAFFTTTLIGPKVQNYHVKPIDFVHLNVCPFLIWHDLEP